MCLDLPRAKSKGLVPMEIPLGLIPRLMTKGESAWRKVKIGGSREKFPSGVFRSVTRSPGPKGSSAQLPTPPGIALSEPSQEWPINFYDLSLANSIEYLVSMVDETMPLKELNSKKVRLLSTRFNFRSIEVLSMREPHNLRKSNSQKGVVVSYDELYDSLVQFKPHVLASKANKVAKNHDSLALLTHLNASSSLSHANSSYSPQPYYVTHPSSVAYYEDEYQGELQGDSQEDKLTTAMMLLARAITQKFSIPNNNRLRYGGNGNRNVGRQNRNQAFNEVNRNDESNQIIQRVPQTESNPGKENVHCYNCSEKCHYARDCKKPRVRDAKYFREQMLLAMKDEAKSNLKDEENDFMLDNSYGDETFEINASNKVHEQVNHVKCKTIIHISDNDQINSNIIFDDLYVENNSGTSEHHLNAHDEYHDI
nr:hypothetical protein [Tanacetum cinerariifolium]